MIYCCAVTFLALTSIYGSGRNMVRATVDVNLSELEYLASHLDLLECRKLIAALHYRSYELPKNLAKAERKVDVNIPCLRQLLHWNTAANEGRGLTHEHIQHRLRQIGRKDLADWLGKTTFKELSKDLFRSFEEPFPEIIPETTTAETTTDATEVIVDKDDEDFWIAIEMIAMGLFAALSFAFIIVVGLVIINQIARCRQENEEILIDEKCEENCELLSK